MQISEVKWAIANRAIVEYDGHEYYMWEYRLALCEKTREWAHIAVIHDLRANSVMSVDLEKAKLVKGKVFRNGKVVEIDAGGFVREV